MALVAGLAVAGPALAGGGAGHPDVEPRSRRSWLQREAGAELPLGACDISRVGKHQGKVVVKGTVRDVSMSIGSWLIAEGYAEPEMRHDYRLEDLDYSGPRVPRDSAHDHPRRRSTDR